jgi:hypothetical protein
VADYGVPTKQEVTSFLAGRAAELRKRKGMGDATSDLRALPLPPALERYLQTGAPMSTIRRDLGAATAQIPRWGFGVLAAVAFLLAGSAYRRWRDAR